MTQPWKHLQGQVIGGKFALVQHLGGSDHSAVFLTERPQGEPRKAAVKLVAASPEKAALQLSRWAEAEKMSHPNVLRLFEMGRCRVGGEDLLYLVMEYAEENLSQVVAARPLTPQESSEMLPSVLEALAYVHRQGFVHGHLKPANVMAAGEQLKIACDGLVLAREAGTVQGTPSVYDPPETATEGLSAAGDVWSLGMTLVEVLTQKVPALEAGRREPPPVPRSTPAVLADVVRHCLCLDPKQRWTVKQIAARLSPVAAASPTQNESGGGGPLQGLSKKIYLAAAVAVAILLAVFFASRRASHSRAATEPAAAVEAQAPAANNGKPAPAVKPVAPAPAKQPVPAAKVEAQSLRQQAIIREVLPKVPESARDTIQGTIRVRVRVSLDASGDVASARFDSAGPSKYFARISMVAAQGWKFAPPAPQGPNQAQEWVLRFEFRRDSTHVIPTPIGR